MKTYTIGKLAALAGISVRTLHHYDHVGLLSPSQRSGSGYRHYQRQDLLRLQQILFFRELGFSLRDIHRILDDPEFNPMQALRLHRKGLRKEIERLQQLLQTIDATMDELKEEERMLSDEELYEGFSKDEIERMKQEARQRYDPQMVEESEKRVRRMSKGQWKAVQEEGGRIAEEMAALIGESVADPGVQALMARQRSWLEHFYPVTSERFRGLGQMYAQDPEFRAFYDKFGPGLADFMQAAMVHYAEACWDREEEE